MKKHVPNFITCLNLFSGCVGVVFALNQQLEAAAYCVVASGVFDFFDGLVARALKVKSAIGKELDSLADVVSFGLLPGAVLYSMLETAMPHGTPWPYLGFVVTVFSALRLAKFNVDDRQTSDFIGLNTPMNAFYVVSLPFVAQAFGTWVCHPIFLVASILFTSLLLVSNVRLFAMKLSSWSWRENRWRYLFVALSTVAVSVLQFAAVPLVLILYFGCSLLHYRGVPMPSGQSDNVSK